MSKSSFKPFRKSVQQDKSIAFREHYAEACVAYVYSNEALKWL